mmetsp:Transcript_49126/g.76621  ORF Transcript_49126/g.76621 Transcript_49126/m.76621 type:complete len:395 (+) Transcript_49126:580-1764(+)
MTGSGKMPESSTPISTLVKQLSAEWSTGNRSNSSYHSMGEERTMPPPLDDVPLDRDAPSPSGVSGLNIDIATGDVLSSLSYRSLQKSESESSLTLIERFSNIPLHVRGRAEAWEVPDHEIKIIRKIGQGMGGEVHLCRWRGLDCAAKLLTNNDCKTSVEYMDMINEISTVSHLRHPNLVLFLGAVTVKEPLLILSEFMAGGSLEDRMVMKRKELGHFWRPNRSQAYRWMMDLSRAVCFLHNCTTPIIHRDLKPGNLLLTDDDRLKVSDFGLSKTLKKVKEDGTPYTMTGNTGTKRYMAPEVVLSNPHYDEKVDIYSMAMIFYFIVKGERPFEHTDPDLITRMLPTPHLQNETPLRAVLKPCHSHERVDLFSLCKSSIGVPRGNVFVVPEYQRAA